jgi:hypothetical protein
MRRQGTNLVESTREPRERRSRRSLRKPEPVSRVILLIDQNVLVERNTTHHRNDLLTTCCFLFTLDLDMLRVEEEVGQCHIASNIHSPLILYVLIRLDDCEISLRPDPIPQTFQHKIIRFNLQIAVQHVIESLLFSSE